MKRYRLALLGAVGLALATALAACEKKAESAGTVVTVHAIDAQGVGGIIGTLTLNDAADGLSITPDLAGLPPGPHGFHLHENANCAPGEKDGQPAAGLGAGGHFDPAMTGHHEGPAGAGHRGDLPVLIVDAEGKATTPVSAPHLKLADLPGHAFMIHEGGDNYADTPVPLGGGGKRIACGAVPPQ